MSKGEAGLLGQRFDNVWDAIAKTPEEAAVLTLRSELMTALRHEIGRWNLTQAEAAARLGISQPRLNKLVKGRFNEFRLDALAELASRAGLTVQMKIDRPKGKARKPAQAAAA